MLQLSKTVNSGIDIDTIPGYVAPYYEMAACKAANYRYYHDWQELEPYQQAKLIAHYLLSRMVDAHMEDAQNKYQEQQSKRAAK